MINSVNTHTLYRNIYIELQSYLNENHIAHTVSSSAVSSNAIELINVSLHQVKEIVDNFDIISKAASHRAGLIRPSLFGTEIIDYDFSLLPNGNAPLVGIIDTGVNLIGPLRDYIERNGPDLTGGGLSILDNEGHGTAVAGLVILGEEFYKERKRSYRAKARIFPIKLIERDGDSIKVNELCEAVIRAHVDHGVRIFNLSVNESTNKSYNSSISNYAYCLDKIAYQYDLLILISAGNLDIDDIKEMDANEDTLHDYPNHFFNPKKLTFYHSCEGYSTPCL